jgi:putative colanic acid biosysnthesis UDP-glucose lipid carrier transferase
MNTSKTNLFRFFFAFLDLLSINMVHLTLMIIVDRAQSGPGRQYILLFIITDMTWLACAYITGLYINDKLMEFERFAKRTAQSFFLFFTIVLLFLFLHRYDYSRLFVSLDFLGIIIVLLVTRVLFILGGKYLRNKERHTRKIIVLGYNDLSKQLVDHFITAENPISIEGYFENFEEVRELSVFPILGNRFDCVPYAKKNGVTEIYSTISPEDHRYVYELAQTAEMNMIRFKFVPDFRMFVNRNIHIDFVQDIPILSLRSEPLEDIAARIKKRVFDIIFSFLVLTLIMSWLLPILAILIKLSSKGPVFFVQARSGKNNQPFNCYKFRSLKVNPLSDVKQVTQNDNRFTTVGKFLRKTNLDEFPQFFNVFIGNMTVVGPRPHMLRHTQDYSRILNSYMIRHFVKPGVTGWAQVNGFRGEIKEEEQLRKRIEHDIWYMEHWSIWLDIRIVFMTLFTTLKGDKHAY